MQDCSTRSACKVMGCCAIIIGTYFFANFAAFCMKMYIIGRHLCKMIMCIVVIFKELTSSQYSLSLCACFWYEGYGLARRVELLWGEHIFSSYLSVLPILSRFPPSPHDTFRTMSHGQFLYLFSLFIEKSYLVKTKSSLIKTDMPTYVVAPSHLLH